jgi:photosystem II stability/assembly factor-like uncharacterized protein
MVRIYRTIFIFVFCVLFLSSAVKAQWISYGPDSGPATSVTFSDNKVFISTDPGGLFRSVGTINNKYELIHNGLEFIAHPFANTITADPYRTGYMFAGLHKVLYYSTDLGDNWESAGLIADHAIKKIFFYDQNTIYVLTHGGLYKSVNAGTSWQAVAIGIELVDFEIDRTNNILYACSMDSVIKSTDQAVTWNGISDLPNYEFLISDLYINPSNNSFYLVSFMKIFKSTNPPSVWQDITYDAPTSTYEILENRINGETFIAVVDGLMKLSGNTWIYSSDGMEEIQGSEPVPVVCTGIIQHPVNASEFYATTTAGAYYSSNSCSTWKRIGAPSSEILDIVVMPGSTEKILTGSPRGNQIYENGSWTNTDNYWDIGADAYKVLMHPVDNNIFYSIGQSGWPSVGQIVVTTDYGITWDIFQQFGGTGRLQDIAVNPANPNIVVLASFNAWGMEHGLYMAADKGITETSFYPVTATSTLSFTAVTFDAAGNIYAASIEGNIYKSTDQGSTFNIISTVPVTPDLYIKKLVFHQDKLYACGPGLRVSSDNGLTWNLVGFENKDVVDLTFDPDDGSYFYAAVNKEGIFYSSDAGAAWTSFRPQIPNKYIYSLAVYQPSRKLLVGTLGSSLMAITLPDIVPVELTAFNAVVENGKVLLKWSTATETNNRGFEIERKEEGGDYSVIGFIEGNGTAAAANNYSYTDVPGVNAKFVYRLKQIDYDGTYEYSGEVTADMQLPSEFALEQNYPNPFNPVTTIAFSLPYDSEVVLRIYNVLGQEVKQLLHNNLNAGRHEIRFDASGLNSGIYIYSIEASGKDGVRFSDVRKMSLLK